MNAKQITIKFFLAFIGICLLETTAQASPIVLTDTKGRTIKAEIISRNGESVTFRRQDGKEFTTAVATFDLKTQKLLSDYFTAREKAEMESRMHNAYAAALANIPRAKRTLKYFSGTDSDVAKLVIELQEAFVKEYERDESLRRNAYDTYMTSLNKIFELKQVVGHKYNEILKREVETPMEFNLYKDSDSFYIKVGDGNFSTVASITAEELLRLVEANDRLNTWIYQCIENKMDVGKDVGTFGGVSIEFVSSDSSDHLYLWLTAKGVFDSDRLLEKQVVRVNFINWRSLIAKISKAQEIYDAREVRRANAEKLK